MAPRHAQPHRGARQTLRRLCARCSARPSARFRRTWTHADQTKSLFVSKIFDNQDFGYLKITVERPLRLNFAVTDERIARFKNTGTFLELAISQEVEG